MIDEMSGRLITKISEYSKETGKDSIRPIHCTKRPAYNVLSQEEFQERANLVFSILDEILGKSFGAFGAPTIIANYPYTHITKDGFTIARNINFDHIAGEPVDRVIAGMAVDICGRLNYAVGDGTTSAIIATNQIYRAAMKAFPEQSNIRARDLIAAFTSVKDKIIVELQKAATPITDENLTETIRKIVEISSNGDEFITSIIADAYDKLRYPSIHTEKSDTANTYCDITTGYPSKVRITDQIYVNSENKRAEHKNVDILVFDHRVKRSTYDNILVPLVNFEKMLGRHLLCIAPSYDEDAINTVIRRDLNLEYSRRNDITLILCAYPASTGPDKKAIADLAMLAGTTLIDKGIENSIIEAHDENPDIRKIINISNRGIEGISVFSGEGCDITKSSSEIHEDDNSYLLDMGFAESFTASMKDSIFVFNNYNENLYAKYLEDAKNDLEEITKKFEILGTFTKDVYEAQTRYTSLLMKTATIYVGGDSVLSRDMLQDSVDDAVRAAESAFQYGYVLGCNVTLSGIIDKMIEAGEGLSELEMKVLSILRDGFRAVYYRVMSNAIDDSDECAKGKDSIVNIIEHSIAEQEVYDLSTMTYTRDVINSTKTDIEILTATVDLLKLLLTGNQMILTNYVHEEG